MDFDRYAEDYQAAVSTAAGVSVDALAGEKARVIRDVLATTFGDPRRLRVLDIGCGIGLIERYLDQEVRELFAVDLSLRSLDYARQRAPRTQFAHYDGGRLPFEDAMFDVAFTSCVLHHVVPSARPAFMTEMLRVLRPGGAVIVIEHNPLNPATRYIVSRCAFDADASLFTCWKAAKLIEGAGASIAGRRYTGFLPFRNAIVERAERAIGWLPAGAQYCIWGLKRASS
jgi:ubiquinone/menaquinone biosynthesis C-methylase UbiE